MKYVKNIKPIRLTNLFDVPYTDENGEEIMLDMHSFLLQRLVDSRFGSSVENLIISSQLKKAIDKSKNEGSEYIELETNDWNTLVEVVKVPSQGNQYNTHIAHCLVPFIQAVLNASDEKKQ